MTFPSRIWLRSEAKRPERKEEAGSRVGKDVVDLTEEDASARPACCGSLLLILGKKSVSVKTREQLGRYSDAILIYVDALNQLPCWVRVKLFYCFLPVAVLSFFKYIYSR